MLRCYITTNLSGPLFFHFLLEDSLMCIMIMIINFISQCTFAYSAMSFKYYKIGFCFEHWFISTTESDCKCLKGKIILKCI